MGGLFFKMMSGGGFFLSTSQLVPRNNIFPTIFVVECCSGTSDDLRRSTMIHKQSNHTQEHSDVCGSEKPSTFTKKARINFFLLFVFSYGSNKAWSKD